jgi:subtilisin family serine protease
MARRKMVAPKSVAPKRKATGRARAARAAKPSVPDVIYAQASPHSMGGVSMFASQTQIHASTVMNFLSEEGLITRAVARLQEAGFTVLQASQLTINIAGSRSTYERAFNTQIVAEERPTIKELGVETTATYLECPDTDLPGLISAKGTAFDDLLEGVALEEPRYFMAASMFAPLKSYWHLRIPGDVSLGLNADRAHRGGITGKGVRVAMCDTGWFKHPYFVGRGYRAAPVTLGPAAANPLKDEVGHGTGESANIFAVAPDAELMPVKISFVNTIGGFNAAVGLGPQIITCSWGSSKQFGPLSAADSALAAAIAAAVASGITVVFSAGNGHFGFPGQHPDVISAGGVFMDIDESLKASNYASGFLSNIYVNRRVPDVCGLVGMLPKAIYIMLPIEPGDEIDATPFNQPGGLQGGTFPQGDETTASDGWGAFSGTSAAAPQTAGAAALIKQACPALTPAEIKQILMQTAKDVTTGTCNPATGGNAAGPGPDLATGNGLVDAQRAVLSAKIKCLGPILPITPITAITPITPITTITPVTPITTITPITPITTITPITPITGITPITPITAITPITPIRPSPITPINPILPQPPETIRPAETMRAPAGRGGEVPRLSAEDVAALQTLLGEPFDPEA